jgi:hypothetical protein
MSAAFRALQELGNGLPPLSRSVEVHVVSSAGDSDPAGSREAINHLRRCFGIEAATLPRDDQGWAGDCLPVHLARGRERLYQRALDDCLVEPRPPLPIAGLKPSDPSIRCQPIAESLLEEGVSVGSDANGTGH